jgi:ATP-dependent RNA helicase DeaD
MDENQPTPAESPEQPSPGAEDPALFAGTFDDLAIPDGVRQGLSDLGYSKPTRVQSEVFFPVSEGNDLVVQSRTGSGKTTAFSLPVISGIDPSENVVQAICLAPTRELALQVTREAAQLGHHHGIRVATIYGGASIQGQIAQLNKGVHFVVGTPGRVIDLMNRGALKLNKVRFGILDEADEMLSMGFWEDVTKILRQLPKTRQTLLFSATLPPQIQKAAREFLSDPVRVELSGDNVNVDTIRHLYHMEKEELSKPRNFLYVLEAYRPHNAIVFCNRRDETELICQYLKRFGFKGAALNGDMPQKAREKVLAKVKAGELDLMVATDIAARGIDISDLDHVFNYDLPEFDEVYVHRVGRTGRIGKKGTAVSLVRGKYLTHLSALKREYGVPLEERHLPDEKEIIWMQAERIAAQLLEEADGVEIGQYRQTAEAMMERGDAAELVAFLLRSHFSAPAPAPSSDEGPREDRGERRGRDRDRDRGRDRDRKRRDRRDRDDRGDRSEARGDDDDDAPRDADTDADGDSPTVRLYVTLGKADGHDSLMGLAEAMAEMSGVDIGHFTGAGDLRDHSSHVEVDREVYEAIVEAVHGQARAPRADEVEASEAEGEDGDTEPGREGGVHVAPAGVEYGQRHSQENPTQTPGAHGDPTKPHPGRGSHPGQNGRPGSGKPPFPGARGRPRLQGLLGHLRRTPF